MNNDILTLYWLFAAVYAFVNGGFWWGVFNIIVPIAPMIDLAEYLKQFV
jgi:hypothetical protein